MVGEDGEARASPVLGAGAQHEPGQGVGTWAAAAAPPALGLTHVAQHSLGVGPFKGDGLQPWVWLELEHLQHRGKQGSCM